MGEIERKIKADVRRTKINRAIVGTLAVAGSLALAVLAPNVLGALGKLGLTPQRKQSVQRSLSRLIRRGYVVLVEEGGKRRARLTPKGERFAALLGEGALMPKKPARWDGKWRMLIFDISSRRLRDHTRMTLRSLGLHRLQDSVWVYPYDCEDLITIFKTDFRLGKNLLYIVADAVEYDTPLRRHFDLPQR
jgi:DNA-binding transcriptional regulator PaaX